MLPRVSSNCRWRPGFKSQAIPSSLQTNTSNSTLIMFLFSFCISLICTCQTALNALENCLPLSSPRCPCPSQCKSELKDIHLPHARLLPQQNKPSLVSPMVWPRDAFVCAQSLPCSFRSGFSISESINGPAVFSNCCTKRHPGAEPGSPDQVCLDFTPISRLQHSTEKCYSAGPNRPEKCDVQYCYYWDSNPFAPDRYRITLLIPDLGMSFVSIQIRSVLQYLL